MTEKKYIEVSEKTLSHLQELADERNMSVAAYLRTQTNAAYSTMIENHKQKARERAHKNKQKEQSLRLFVILEAEENYHTIPTNELERRTYSNTPKYITIKRNRYHYAQPPVPKALVPDMDNYTHLQFGPFPTAQAAGQAAQYAMNLMRELIEARGM